LMIKPSLGLEECFAVDPPDAPSAAHASAPGAVYGCANRALPKQPDAADEYTDAGVDQRG
jgi:hypothetical protein